LTIRLIVLLARRWVWLAVLTVALAAAMGAVTATRLPGIYEATSTLLVTPGLPDHPITDVSVQQGAERLTSTYAALIKSPPILAAAIETGGLELTTDQALKLVDARPLRDTQLLQIVVQSDDPDQAAHLANLVAHAFIDQVQASQASRFVASQAALASQADQLSATLTAQTRQLAHAPTSDADLARPQSQLTRLQDSYAAALRSVEDVRLAQARSSNLVMLVDAAAPPRTPTAPRLLPSVLLAALVGLLIAVFIAAILERLDSRLTSPERVVRLIGLPTQGVLASWPPSVVAAESCRLLWARLRFATHGHPLRSLLVTSSVAGEGKTLVAANLAIAAAQAGVRVILVDADLRHPSLHELFHVRATPGLTRLLANRHVAVERVLVRTPITGLWLVPSGSSSATATTHDGEWRVARCVRQRLAELNERADLVIMDSPPVLAVSDASVLTGLTDGTLLVTDARARAVQVSLAVASLRSAGGRLVGAVLNRVQAAGLPAPQLAASPAPPLQEAARV
jgi:polysaccharide biosynthesis transport protein